MTWAHSHLEKTLAKTLPCKTQNRKKGTMLQSLSVAAFSSSSPFAKTFKFHPRSHFSHSPPPPLYVKFRTDHLQNLRYLKSIGIIDPTAKPHKLPPPDAIAQILATVDFFKSRGFSDSDFSRLAFHCPELFSLDTYRTDIEPVFRFLSRDLLASVQEARGLIVKCPQLLFSDVEHCLKPTLDYLRHVGVPKLNVPSNLNAHLLNVRVEKLRVKVEFLEFVGFSYEEATRFCARNPAIFGYSIENNLIPKIEYLEEEMEKSLDELKEFPHYFGFSLEKRIVPRHLHLKERNVKIKLNKMLICSDSAFYSKWK